MLIDKGGVGCQLLRLRSRVFDVSVVNMSGFQMTLIKNLKFARSVKAHIGMCQDVIPSLPSKYNYIWRS